MASQLAPPVGTPTLPDVKLIEKVATACDCAQETAIRLLQRCQHDAERAIRQHSVLNRYLGKDCINLSRPHTPTASEAGQSSDTYPPSPLSDSSSSENPSDEVGSAIRKPTFKASIPISNLASSTGSEAKSKCLLTADKVSTVGALLSPQGEQTLPTGSEAKLISYSLPAVNDLEAASPRLDITEWDFNLPRIPLTRTLVADLEETEKPFSIRGILAAIQCGASLQTVRNYLERYDHDNIRRSINDDVDGFPAMFYIIQSNDESLLRLWVDYGGNAEAVYRSSKMPLLAFAIIDSERVQTDTTLITTLLSLGASPHAIPSAFYAPFLRDLPEVLAQDVLEQVEKETDLDGSTKDDPDTAWCVGKARAKFARTITLSQRYFLEKASKTKRPSQRHIQLAQRRNAVALLGLPYFLVGQTLACNLLLQILLSHLIVPSKRPLVLVFAGPSGHGKTELARKMGHLLSLELEVVDCTIFNREFELFGPREPYVGSEKGSPLNNFLARNAGKRCIVFLDEFEKTTSDIHKGLLLPFDNGEYQDRRNRSTINCSNTIWILATNAHDSIIQKFCATNDEVMFGDDNEAEKSRLSKTLSPHIKQDFLSKFGSPITGRISAFIPFLPFSLGEQAVVTHKYLLELGSTVQGPVDLSHGNREKLLGDVRVRIRRDASVCRILAKAEYHADLGARSLINGVETIKHQLVEAYLEVDEQIMESLHKSTFLVDVHGDEILVRMSGQNNASA